MDGDTFYQWGVRKPIKCKLMKQVNVAVTGVSEQGTRQTERRSCLLKGKEKKKSEESPPNFIWISSMGEERENSR